MAGFEVAGRRFHTQADYEAALRDQKKIDEIKKNVDLKQPGDVIRLYNDMQAGTYRFETMVGNDFDDSIYELAMEYKEQGFTKDSKTVKEKKTRGNGIKAKKESKNTTSKTAGRTVKESSGNKEIDPEMQKEVELLLQKKERNRKILVLLCSLVAVGCLGYFGVYSFFADRTQNDYESLANLKGDNTFSGQIPTEVTIHYTEDEEVTLNVLDEYKTLYNKNKSLIGWLKIEGTKIDYPVMQTSNNEYYLDHNFEQEYDKNGSLFLDKDCDVVKRNTNLIIYGHHMKSGKMFGNLNDYSNEDFAKAHSRITFDTIYEKGTYEVMYVFRSRIYNEDEIVFKYYQFLDATSEQEFNSNMQEMAELSLYDTGVTAVYGDQLLTLSTCDSSETDGRFVVVAKRIE